MPSRSLKILETAISIDKTTTAQQDLFPSNIHSSRNKIKHQTNKQKSNKKTNRTIWSVGDRRYGTINIRIITLQTIFIK